MASTVDAYLDRLFDLLAGTGATGRRAVAEAESHLNESVEALMAGGLGRDAAEAEAITRFGAPETVARAHLKGGALPFAAVVGRVFAAKWLLIGVAGVAIGLSGLIAGGLARVFGPYFLVPDAPGSVLPPERCAQLARLVPDASSCHAASVTHHLQELTQLPLDFGVAGVVLLGLFWLARRFPALRPVTTLPNAAMVSTAGLVAFGGVGGLCLATGLLALAMGERFGIGMYLAQGVAGVLTGLVFLPAAWRQLSLRAA